MRCQRVFLLHVDDVVGTELFGHLDARPVLGGAGDDDQRRAGLLADHGLRQALLARALDQHRGIVADAALEQRPLDAVRHRRHQPGKLGRHALRHVMHHRVPWQIDVLGEAAPQMRRLLGRGVAVADGVRIGAPVGVLAMAVLAGMAPFAFAAAHIMLDKDQVAFLEALARGEFAAGLGDDADILMSHDGRRVARRMLVELDVGAADAADFHLHQRRVRRDIRHRILADFGLARPRAHRRQHCFSHCMSPYCAVAMRRCYSALLFGLVIRTWRRRCGSPRPSARPRP